MILDRIEWSDCAVFLAGLIPQLLINVNVFKLLQCAAIAIPYLVLIMPVQFVHERFLTPRPKQSPFVQQATIFQDIVVRCVRFAFAYIDPAIGRVFFSKWVSLPFMRWRMLRNGFARSPVMYKEITTGRSKGVYIVEDDRPPSILIFYLHGGGFTMGSPYFYMEFLMAWMALLKDAGHPNPAVLAMDYTLVPSASYPTQVQEALDGYKHALTLVDASRIVVSGDSAGGTLVLSLMLCLTITKVAKPALAALISPWTTLISDNNANTASDYLNGETLTQYGKQYIGSLAQADDAKVSPGDCKDLALWRRAAPSKGMYFIYGTEEVLAPEIRNTISTLKKADINVASYEEPQWIHAWPIVKLFLSNRTEDRLGGLQRLADIVHERIGPV